MNHKIKEIVNEKLAKLLDHLYFQDSKSTIPVIIILIFFIQKINLMMLSNNNQSLREQEVYFNVCETALSWVSFQKPLQILNSHNVNTIITLLYTVIQLAMFLVFCFSPYKWQFISKIFSFYISNFQLLILYHIQIHILSQKYQLTFNVLVSLPLYINYMIIVYCSRNYFIMSQNILRRYSIYNYVIILFDYLNFILFNLLSANTRQYLILTLFLVYFFDSFFFKPYSTKINIIYVFATSTLVVSSLIKIFMINFSISDQIYVAFMLSPLISVLIIQLLQISQQNIINSEFSLELLIILGEFIIDSPQNQILKNVGERLIQKFNPQLQLSPSTLLDLLQNYQDNLILKERNSQWSKQKLNQQKEEVYLYIIFLSHSIKGSYLQCLMQAKKFQLQNKNHSLFFEVISNLLSQKYDKEVESFGKTEAALILNNHQKLISAREFLSFYQNNIEEILEILDEKISIWNKILQGFDYIDDALNLVINLHKKINFLINKHQFTNNSKDQKNNLNSLKNSNILILRYFSFFYSYIENDFLKSFVIEKQIEQLLGNDRDKNYYQTINMSIFKGEISIISASILENKGALIKSYTKDLNNFFNLQSQIQKIQYINQLMPNFIQENHNGYIEEFISKGASDLYNKSKLVFGLDGYGFVLPLQLSFLHINEKSNDFILTAILKKSFQGNNELIIFQENGKIIGITKKVYQSLVSSQIGQQSNQEINVKIYDCFVQFFIPQAMQLISIKNNDPYQNITKQLVDIFLIQDIHQIIFMSKQIEQENHLTTEAITQSIYQIYLNQIDKISPQKIQIEAEYFLINLPNSKSFHCLQFPNLSQSNEIFQILSQENIMGKISPTNQQSYKKHLETTEENFFKKQEYKEPLRSENLESQFQNFTFQHQEQIKESDMSFQVKGNLIYNQALSQSSQESSNSNIQIYEIMKQIVENNSLNKYVKSIFMFSILFQSILILISAISLKLYHNQNSFLQEKVQLVRYPDKFNRLYCSFTTMGQLDLERSLLGLERDEYVFYRIKELSESLREQMEDLMPNLRIQFSNLEESNRLPKLNIRIMNYFSYSEETMRMIQFNFLAEAMTDSLNQKILSSLEYSGDEKNLVMDQYFQLQFLKGNLVNQISSSQSLIDQIIDQINDSNSVFYHTIQMLLLTQLLLIFFLTSLKIYFWRKSYVSIGLMIQLISYSSDDFIYKSINRVQQGKQYIKSHVWKQVNYFNAHFCSVKQQTNYERGNSIRTKSKSKSKLAISSRINHQQFQLKIVCLKLILLMILKFGVVLANYIYLTEISASSEPEMELTLEYVQFKQDWDSLMILSYLLKTNSVLTQKISDLGFLNNNQQLNNQSLYFKTIYNEFLQSFSETVPQAESFNLKIFSDIVSSNRMLQADKDKLYNLFENDLCVALFEELPFCSFNNGKFTYFPQYPTPQTLNNNREIFKGGINRIFQKILEIFQSYYQLELLNIKETNHTETTIFIQTQEFNLYILQYFFDINKAVVEFYSTILGSIFNLLQLDFQSILLFQMVTIVLFFKIYMFVLIYFLWNLEFLIRASKSSLTLLPQECLAESQFLAIIKKIKEER